MSRRVLIAALAAAMAVPALVPSQGTAAGGGAVSSAGHTRQISAVRSTRFGAAVGSAALKVPDVSGAKGDSGAHGGVTNDRAHSSLRSVSGAGGVAQARPVVRNPKLLATFEAINHRQQRLANNGNQFSLEPPDQGLCVGNGQVLEAVNDATRVYAPNGAPLTPVTDLNTFYGYPPARVVGSPTVYGPELTDPSCLFDAQTQRWFMVVLTLETVPSNGNFTGDNHLDIAVSDSPDATGTWTTYSVSATDDGNNGTPNHGCTLNGPGSGTGPCFGDYPHIGADNRGFYITTNEYAFFGPEFHGAQIYAFSKAALAANAATVNVTQFDTHGLDNGNSGFTIWPSQSSGGNGTLASSAHGTEFFMSSNAADEAHGDGTAIGPRTSNQLLVWALTNTNSLDSASPNPALSHAVLTVGRYGTPPRSDQRPGQAPLRDCLNDPACSTFLNGTPDPFTPETLSPLDSNDTRMQQVSLAHGELWGALDTALTMSGETKAGIEYFIVTPSIVAGHVVASIDHQGYFGQAHNNVIYPAIGVNSAGHAVMGFTLVGPDYFPSAAYTALEVTGATGLTRIAANGLGPQDGFTGYKFYGQPPGTTRPRWGDYGAAAVDGSTVWIASEYIGQTCSLAQYEAAPFGSCNGTRTALANWDTRISHFSFG